MMKKKLLPLPGSLSTQMKPFISSTNLLTIAKPKPVPPYFATMLLSAWVKCRDILLFVYVYAHSRVGHDEEDAGLLSELV